MPCNPPKWRIKAFRSDSPAGMDGRGFVKSWSSRRHAKTGAGGAGGLGTGVSPAGTTSDRGSGLFRPFRAFRKRASAVSAWTGAPGNLVAGPRCGGVRKTNCRKTGAAVVVAPSRRCRLRSTRSRVVTAARNQGVSMVPAGPSPGKPRVLSKRPSGPTRSDTA